MNRAHTAEFLPLAPFLDANAAPEKVLRRLGDQVWQVRVQPVDFTKDSVQTDWAMQRRGELVRIPLLPYRTNSQSPAEFGLSVMDMATRLFMDFPQAIRIHIVFGDPVENLLPEAEAFRYWVGVAMQLH